MENKKNFFKTILLLLFSTTGLFAQQSANASGGDASGSGGTSSFSLGQIVYTTQTGSNGSVSQGVQQPYEISTVLATTQAFGINLQMLVYPNPTTDIAILKIDNYDLEKLSFDLFDINGKLIETRKNIQTVNTIDLSDKASAIYFLKILDVAKEIKTFKIIKK
jgi:Secretion system C-terminal sorting domain